MRQDIRQELLEIIMEFVQLHGGRYPTWEDFIELLEGKHP